VAADRVVLIHGFTQTAASWPATIVNALRDQHDDVIAVDVPGHGQAGRRRATLAEYADQLAQRYGGAHYVGYSLGGRIALHIVAQHPAAVESLATIGATGGIDDPAERAARAADDEALATSIERDGLDAFLEGWLANPLFATLPPDAVGLEERRANSTTGLAASLRLMGTGTQQPLWDELQRCRAPALFIAGALDEKFTANARRLADVWGGPASVAIIEGAGHAAHLERPRDVAARIVAFHGSTRASDSSAP
jgi:2-succinyl-6-hydroxy-2,4-cyclohexadiene-1-carboxylate synthase